MMPLQNQSVTVGGDVQYTKLYFYDWSLSANNYIERSGDMSLKADKSRIYAVRANGSVSKIFYRMALGAAGVAGF
jgi:hypothetical protein